MTDNDFDAQRTELANRFASAGAEFLGQMPLAAAALAEVPNTQPQQYAMVGEPKAIRALLPSDDIPARRMRHGQRPTEPLEWEPPAIANKATEEGELPMDEQSRMLRTGKHVFDSAKRSGWKDDGEGAFEYFTRMIYAQAIAADRASRQVANKAEVDLSSLNVQTGADIELVYCNRDEEFVRLDDVKALLATPPATTGASTVLMDERTSIHCQEFHELAMDYRGAPAFNGAPEAYRALVAYIDQHVAREVAAQAGQVAVPGWISIAEHLPELHATVALLDENRWMNTGSSDHNVNWHGAGYLCEFGQKYWSVFGETRSQCLDAVTHWMPIPAAPDVQASTAGGRQEGGK